MKNLTQEEIVKMMQDFELPVWAEKSKFYSQVMSDGNIFNPYIHRRFLPAHFKKILLQTKEYQSKSVDFEIAGFYVYGLYGHKRLLDIVKKEMGLLIYLQKKDKLAYEERSLIWNLQRCKTIYVESIQSYTNSLNGIRWTNPVLTNKNGDFIDFETLKGIFNDYAKSIEKACSYKELLDIVNTHFFSFTQSKRVDINNFSLVINPNLERNIRDLVEDNVTLLDTFLLAGAYYSLKNQYMFNRLTKSLEKLDQLLRRLADGETWTSFAAELPYCK